MKNLRSFISRILPAQSQKTAFRGFWHGPPLGLLRQVCLKSFVDLGHTYELYCYEKVDVPDGVILRDAGEIIPFSELFYYTNPLNGKPDISPFSDLFRFKLLLERGGWWSDVDAICLSSDIPEVERAWAQELPEVKPRAVGTSQIAFSAGDPIVAELYKRCLALCTSDLQIRESTGPVLISSTLEDLNCPANCYGTADTLYPVRWIEMFKLWLPQFFDEMKQKGDAAIFMPIYASYPQYLGLSLGKLPPEGSYLAYICDLHSVEHDCNERYDADEVLEGLKLFLRQNHSWAVSEVRAVAGMDALLALGLGKRLVV